MRTYTGIDVLTCVQGNTVRTVSAEDHYKEGCVVFDFSREASARGSNKQYTDKEYSGKPSNRIHSDATYKKRRMLNRRKKTIASVVGISWRSTTSLATQNGQGCFILSMKTSSTNGWTVGISVLEYGTMCCPG